MRLAPGSLATRIALVTVAGVIVGSTCVALIAQLISVRMAGVREDTTLRDAAKTLALELQEPGSVPSSVTEDETRELAHAGISVAAFDGSAFIAGDRFLERVAPGSCRDVGTLRTCAEPAGAWLAVVARDQRGQREQQRLAVFASALAVLLTSALGAFGAVAVARLVFRPLALLTNAVEHVPADDPGSVDLGTSSDLAEVDALRDSLRGAFLRLGAALAQSRRFASDAAHELRTPLATLIGELELLAEQLNHQHQEGTTRALKLALRMSKLTDRLLILARLDHLNDRERVEVRELVEEAIDTLPTSIRARVSIESTPETDPVAVDGDRALLVTTFVNALENALKFSDGQVRVAMSVRANEVCVSVIDLGVGVARDERELVFAPFYRTASSRASAVPGHGIGLALIAHVVALHGGRASFADCVRGATLDLVLPLAHT